MQQLLTPHRVPILPILLLLQIVPGVLGPPGLTARAASWCSSATGTGKAGKLTGNRAWDWMGNSGCAIIPSVQVRPRHHNFLGPQSVGSFVSKVAIFLSAHNFS